MKTLTADNSALKKAHEIGKRASELGEYQDEPLQMHSGAVGKSGYLKLGFTQQDQRSVMTEMDRRVPFLVQKALYWDEELPNMPCIFMISTSGGILQGDRLALEIHVNANACAHITSQSATKIHAMDQNYATQIQSIRVEENGYLEMIPDQVIPHSNSRFISDTTIALHPTATVIYSEILMSGRKYHEEDNGFNFDVYSSRIVATDLEQHEHFVEKYVLAPKKDPLSVVGVMGDFNVFGNVVLLTPVEHHDKILARINAVYDTNNGVASGVSRLPNQCGLIFKVLGQDSQQVKTIIRDFWKVAREEIIGHTVPNQFLWRQR